MPELMSKIPNSAPTSSSKPSNSKNKKNMPEKNIPEKNIIVWHRGDLRTHDHPALEAAYQTALENNLQLIPLVVIDEVIFARKNLSPRRKAWFLNNVAELRKSYQALGTNLVVKQGNVTTVIPTFAKETNAASVYYLESFTPYGRKRDSEVTTLLRQLDIETNAFDGLYMQRPDSILAASTGKPYKVYTPFMKAWRKQVDVLPIAKTPQAISPFAESILCGEIPFVESDIQLPPAGEEAALDLLQTFLATQVENYHDSRNAPIQNNGTSKLAPYLTVGSLSPRKAFNASNQASEGHYICGNELIWRDFNASLLYHFPDIATEPFNQRWQSFPWAKEDSISYEENWQAWCTGNTGYALVDAGMRELNATGFMHNRVRMVTASFLCKHLMIDWQKGEDYFRTQLLDGDSSQNIGNWQWVAGCGADASPYFRIFNPITQVKKFSAEAYVRKWCPELTHVPDKYLGLPEEAPEMPLSPIDYPNAIVDHKQAREHFLEIAKAHFQKVDD